LHENAWRRCRHKHTDFLILTISCLIGYPSSQELLYLFVPLFLLRLLSPTSLQLLTFLRVSDVSGPFAQSWGTRRCRFIVHIADLSALVLIHELPEWTSKHYATVRRDSRKRAVSYVSSYIRYSIPVLLQGREVESNGYQDG
jgi:hypothetical protein